MRIRCAVVLGFVILLGAAGWSVTASQAPSDGTQALDRYAGSYGGFGPVAPEPHSGPGARSAPRDTANQSGALPGNQGQSPWLVGTWRLVSLERAEGSQPLASVPNPIGILIQDARGNVIEIVTRAGRAASIDVVEQFMTYQAFWGTYASDAGRSTVTYRINGDLDPARTGQQVMRAYERKGDQLVLTQSASAIAPASRTTWTRVPELEALPDYQREAVGFWQWVSGGLVDASGAMVRPASRDASVIVYTPTGLMAVLYLPPPGRKPFAGRPTVEEARAAIQGAPTYFGPYIVQPKSGSVTHYQIAIPNPGATGNSLQRNFEVRGSELILTFPPTTLNGQPVRNVIHLKRLGGLADMWPEYRR